MISDRSCQIICWPKKELTIKTKLQDPKIII